jgi:Zn-dependent peptidase ImmA (M78 family)
VINTADREKLPVIVVNADHLGERQRFTVAHELGHLYLNAKDDLDIEAACHRFAGAFLLPAVVLYREIGKARRSVTALELFELKRLFGVSAQAIAYRCKDLEIIGPSTCTGLFKMFNARGWRTEEPVVIPKESPARFERLCVRALSEGLISESKASELLQKTVKEVVESMDEPPEGANARPARL